jgi:hypothetical protein
MDEITLHLHSLAARKIGTLQRTDCPNGQFALVGSLPFGEFECKSPSTLGHKGFETIEQSEIVSD